MGPFRGRRLKVRADPLLYFVHVPKTGGSTVLSHLEAFSRRGHGHVEAFIDDDVRWQHAVAKSDWLSGHTQWNDLEPRLAAVPDRPVRLFTCVREPTSHIMSELNWVIEIAERGQAFYDGHPRMAREASEFVRSLGPRTPEDVIECFERFPLMFHDVQFRVVAGRWRPASAGAISDALRRYELVVTSDHVDDLVHAMTGRAPAPGRRLNTSPYHFDRTLFHAPAVREFLSEFNRRDEMLYAAVTGGSPGP